MSFLAGYVIDNMWKNRINAHRDRKSGFNQTAQFSVWPLTASVAVLIGPIGSGLEIWYVA